MIFMVENINENYYHFVMSEDKEIVVNRLRAATLEVKREVCASANSVANGVATSDALFAGGRELLIIHTAEEYRLRLTNRGKLILTK